MALFLFTLLCGGFIFIALLQTESDRRARNAWFTALVLCVLWGGMVQSLIESGTTQVEFVNWLTLTRSTLDHLHSFFYAAGLVALFGYLMADRKEKI